MTKDKLTQELEKVKIQKDMLMRATQQKMVELSNRKSGNINADKDLSSLVFNDQPSSKITDLQDEIHELTEQINNSHILVET